MEEFFKLAIQNVARHGDTDVFPFPIENYIFYDKPQEAVDILKDIHSNFEQAANDYPPLRSRCQVLKCESSSSQATFFSCSVSEPLA